MEHICQNCRLFNEVENTCSVTIVIAGHHYELPVLPSDECHWERIDREIQDELEGEIQRQKEPYFKEKLLQEVDTPVEIKQVRMWSDGKNGYIETPEDKDL